MTETEIEEKSKLLKDRLVAKTKDGALVGKIWYEKHAVDRIQERHIPTFVIEDVIENGEHFFIDKASDFDETAGATDVFLKRHTADMMRKRVPHEMYPGIETARSPSDIKENILVLTKGRNVVKSIFVVKDSRLKKWFRRNPCTPA